MQQWSDTSSYIKEFREEPRVRATVPRIFCLMTVKEVFDILVRRSLNRAEHRRDGYFRLFCLNLLFLHDMDHFTATNRVSVFCFSVRLHVMICRIYGEYQSVLVCVCVTVWLSRMLALQQEREGRARVTVRDIYQTEWSESSSSLCSKCFWKYLVPIVFYSSVDFVKVFTNKTKVNPVQPITK